MQRLHVVGYTDDQTGLILSQRRGAKTGAFTVEVDENFEEVLADLVKLRGGDAETRIPRAESQISVREMQQRLRGGQSIHQVARAAGVSDEWVARFAIPIQAEQAQVVRQAFDLTCVKRNGTSTQPLGTSVWWNLQDRSVVLEDDGWETGWTAALLKDSRWLVKFEYTARKRHQVAEWEVDLKAGTLVSRNRLGTELGFVEQGRRRRPGPPAPLAGGLVSRPAPVIVETPPPAPVVEAAPEPAPPAPAKKRAAAKKAAAKKSAAKKSAAKKAPARKAVAAKKKPATRRPVAKKAPAKKVTGTRTAPRKAVAKKSAVTRAPAKKAVARKTVAKKTAAKKTTAKKAAAKKPGPARRVGPAPVIQTITPPPRPRPERIDRDDVTIGGTRAAAAVLTGGDRPNLTPPPAPAGNKKRTLFRRR